MRIAITFILFFPAISFYGQSSFKSATTRSYNIINQDEIIKANALLQTVKTKEINPDITYHWVYSGSIHTSKGDYEGYLLHGDFASYYTTSKNIKSKGEFNKGLKNGTWTFWLENGELEKTVSYKSGVLNGYTILYDSLSRMVKKIPYRNGKINGHVIEINHKEGTTSKIRYKNSKPYEKKNVHSGKKKVIEKEEPEKTEAPPLEKKKNKKDKAEKKVKANKKEEKGNSEESKGLGIKKWFKKKKANDNEQASGHN